MSYLASTNTLITSQTVTVTSPTTKLLIMAQFQGTATANGLVYMTIGRSNNAIPLPTNTVNLSDRSSAMTNNINGNGLQMWSSQYNTSRFTAYATVVDTPGSLGSIQYSIWAYHVSGITVTTSELVNLTILQVL